MSNIFSIIIPTYNRAELLPRAVNSVLSQTFKDFELIIIDDGSTDDTEKVVKKFQEKDKRIKYICLEKNSGGPGLPRNIGTKNAKGEYLIFLDDDDELLPSALSIFNEKWKEADDNIAAVRGMYINPKTKDKVGFLNSNNMIIGYRESIIGEDFSGDFLTCIKSKIKKEELSYVQIGGYFLFLRLLKKGWKVLLFNEVVGVYHRNHQGPQLTDISSCYKNASILAKSKKYLIEENIEFFIKYSPSKLNKIIKIYVLYLIFANQKKEARKEIKIYSNHFSNSYLFIFLSFLPSKIVYYFFKVRSFVKNKGCKK